MRYVNLGNSEIKVSVVGFGAWAIGGKWWGGTDEKDSINAIIASLDTGVNFIDTAPAYGLGLSEELVAKAIKGKRDKVILATKCGLRWNLNKGEYFFEYSPGISVYRYSGKDSLKYEVEQSLKRLNTDYIDLMQTHWQDPTTPISETMEALMNLKEKGLIRAIGASNASSVQLKEYSESGIINTDQEKYSLIDRDIESDLLPWCQKNGLSMLAYSPQEKGLLTGKISPDRVFAEGDSRIGDPRFSVKNIARVNNLLEKHLKEVAVKHNASFGHIATAWIIKNRGVIALCGARNEKQALENSLAGDILLDNEDLEKFQDFINEYKKDFV
jgi:methylglyoxal reductase